MKYLMLMSVSIGAGFRLSASPRPPGLHTHNPYPRSLRKDGDASTDSYNTTGNLFDKELLRAGLFLRVFEVQVVRNSALLFGVQAASAGSTVETATVSSVSQAAFR